MAKTARWLSRNWQEGDCEEEVGREIKRKTADQMARVNEEEEV